MDRDRTGWRITVPRVSHISALYLITGVCGFVDAACFLSMGGVFADDRQPSVPVLRDRHRAADPRRHKIPPRHRCLSAWGSRGRPLAARAARGAADRVRRRMGVPRHRAGADGHPAAARGRAGAGRRHFAPRLRDGYANALVRRHGMPDLATNVMTLTATALVADSAVAGGHNENWRR